MRFYKILSSLFHLPGGHFPIYFLIKILLIPPTLLDYTTSAVQTVKSLIFLTMCLCEEFQFLLISYPQYGGKRNFLSNV